MLTPELLIRYGFEKVTSTPLEKWRFENIVLHVEKYGGQIHYRVSEVNFSYTTLYIRSEEELQFVLKMAEEGGLISSLAANKAIGSRWEILNRDRLQEVLDKWKN